MADPEAGLIGNAFEALPEAFALVDRHGRIVRANGTLERLLEAGPGTLPGRSLEDFYADRLDIHLAPWRDSPTEPHVRPVQLAVPGRPPFAAQMRAAPVEGGGGHLAVLIRLQEEAGTDGGDQRVCEGAYTLDFEAKTGRVCGALAQFLGVSQSSGRIAIADWLGALDDEDRERTLETLKSGPDDPHHLHRFTCRMRGGDGSWVRIAHQVRVLRRGRRGQPLKLAGLAGPDMPADRGAEMAEDPRLELAVGMSGLCAWEYDFKADQGEAKGPLHAGNGREMFCFQDWRARLHPDDVSRASAAFLGLQFGGVMDEAYRVGDGRGGWLKHHCVARPAPGAPSRAFGYTRLLGMAEEKSVWEPDDIEPVDRAAAHSVRVAEITTWSRDIKTEALTLHGPIVSRLGLGTDSACITREDWLSRIHRDDRHKVGHRAPSYFQARPNRELEYRIRDASGDYIWICVRGGVSEQGADGQAIKLAGILSELDETDSLRRRLQETERRREEAVNAARISAWSYEIAERRIVIEGPILAVLEGDAPQSNARLCWDMGSAQWHKMVHEEDAGEIDRAIADLKAAGSTEVEFRVRGADGAYVWLNLRGGVSARDCDGKALRMSGFLTDITDRRRLEEDLVHRERQLADAVEAGLAGVWSTDHVTGERFARGEVLRWFGKEENDTAISPEDWQGLLHPDSVPAARELRERLAAGEMVGATDLRLRSTDGWRWVRTEGRPVAFDSEGRAVRSAGVMIDVTAERAYAAALAHEKERIDTIYRRSPALMHTIDTQGRTLMVNDHWVACMGYKPEEVLGQPGSWAIHPDDRARVDTELIPQAFSTGELWRQPVRLVTKPGEILETRLSAFIEHDLEGKPVAAHGVFEDVTDINRARRDLEAYAEELERTNRELNRFATVASHDLQEPLRKIAAFSSLLRRRYGGQLDPEADRSLDFLVDAAGRMRTLIDDLLEYSRASSRPLVQEEVDLDRLVGEIIARLELAITESGARIQYDCLPVIEGDPMLITLLFQNLISNAIKYRGDAAPQIRIDAVSDGEVWQLTVSDNGIGIEPKFYDKIFAPFQRLHGREEYEGTGIGLAVCQQAVERHGGKIWLESTPGQGSCFYFTLPARRRQDAVA